MLPVVSVVGRHNAGKTTLVEKLIRALRDRGLHLGTIKHDAHGFEIDVPGKDSYRHRQAGAEWVAIVSPTRLAVVEERKTPPSIEQLVEAASAWAPQLDLLLTEGYKTGTYPKVEVVQSKLSTDLLCQNDPMLWAVACDRPLDGLRVPCFDWNDSEALAVFLLERLQVRD